MHDLQEHISKRDKLKAILSLFGEDKARNAFLDICKNYVVALSLELYRPDSENYSRAPKRYSHPRRSDLHNNIMHILSSLAVQSKKVSPLQREILREMHDRNAAADIIKAYVLAQEGLKDDDNLEDDDGGENLDRPDRQRAISNIAKFHLLAKGE